MNLTPIANALIALIAAVISAFVIPWIQSKVSAGHLDQLQAWTAIAVAAAEQLYPVDKQAAKKLFCVDYLKQKGYDVNTEDVENAIEAEVLRLHNQLYGTERHTPEQEEEDDES